jgi:hypothetical protein
MVTERIENPFAARRALGAAPASDVRQSPSGDVRQSPSSEDRLAAPRLERSSGQASSMSRLASLLRPMTGYEEEVVERRLRDPNTAALCNEIVARCLTAPGADFSAAHEKVRAMSTVERDLAVVQLRRISLGELVELEVACPACGRKNDIDFKLSELPVPVAEIPPQVEVTLPQPGATSGGLSRALDGAAAVTVVARIPSAGDQEDLLAAGLVGESERRTFLLSRVLVRHGDSDGPFDVGFVRAMPMSARGAIERALESAIPDLDLSMAVRCADCGVEFSSPFDVAAFFLPR